MTYEEALAYIHSRPRLPSADSLTRIGVLLDRIGHPERELSFVHVTGTNGKGSVSAMIARMLTLDGRRTGLFISPFILDFRERIQIDGQMIPKEALAELVTRLKPVLDEMEQEGHLISEFELDTALAFCWFSAQKCRMVVLEVGIGGAHDATNCIGRPRLSVIMGIGLDHQQLLGETVEEITREKAGIIKGNPVVCYPFQQPEVMAVLMERCACTGSVLHQPNPTAVQILSETLTGSHFQLGEEIYHLALPGRYQIYNALTALEAARLLELSPSAVKEALDTVFFPARMELIRQDPPVLLDGAHNLHGMTALRDSVLPLKEGKLTALVGMLQDKDRAEALACLAPICDRIITTTVDNPRTASATDTAALCAPYCSQVEAVEDWQEAVEKVLQERNPVLICGSLYLVSDCRRLLTGGITQ